MRSVPRLRLTSHGLARPRRRPVHEVVARFAGLQGQDLASVKWAAGLRAGASEGEVDAALADGSLVRTWPMRGTLHLVAAKDAAWLVRLCAPANLQRAVYRQKQLELDAKTLARSDALLARALEDGGVRTRSELLERLRAAKLSTAGQRGYHLLWHAAVRGLISSGAPRGAEQTFARLQAGSAPREPLVELARRYFSSRGPATVDDFATWAGLTLTQARRGHEGVRAELAEISEGLWCRRGLRAAPSATALALPGFDEYLLGYRDRTAVLEPRFADRVCPGGNGIYHPMLVVDGAVVGTWRRTVKKDRVEVAVSPFRTVPRELWETALAPYARFKGLPLVLAAR